MTEIAHSIDLDLVHKLRDDSAYRQRFFWAETSARIAADLVALRKRRGLNQKQVAEKTGTKQPAISRIEKADYQNWNLNTLRSIADALDARVRVSIEPYEDVLREYDSESEDAEVSTAEALSVHLDQFAPANLYFGAVTPSNLTEEPHHRDRPGDWAWAALTDALRPGDAWLNFKRALVPQYTFEPLFPAPPAAGYLSNAWTGLLPDVANEALAEINNQLKNLLAIKDKEISALKAALVTKIDRDEKKRPWGSAMMFDPQCPFHLGYSELEDAE